MKSEVQQMVDGVCMVCEGCICSMIVHIFCDFCSSSCSIITELDMIRKHEFGIHGFLALMFSGDGYFYNVIQTIVNELSGRVARLSEIYFILFYFILRTRLLHSEILNCLPFGLAMEVMEVQL